MTRRATDRSPASPSLRREAGTAPAAGPDRRRYLVAGIIVALVFLASLLDAVAWHQSSERIQLRHRAAAAELRAQTAEARARAAETRADAAEAHFDAVHASCTGVSPDTPR